MFSELLNRMLGRKAYVHSQVNHGVRVKIHQDMMEITHPSQHWGYDPRKHSKYRVVVVDFGPARFGPTHEVNEDIEFPTELRVGPLRQAIVTTLKFVL